MSEGISNMGVDEFHFWLYASDISMFNMIKHTNLNGHIDGEMFMGFSTPEDCNLQDVNKNVLNRFIDLKRLENQTDDGTGIVHISAKIIQD
jgi:hypothetical protein